MSIATEIERIKKAKENIINTLKANDIQIEENATIDEVDVVINKVIDNFELVVSPTEPTGENRKAIWRQKGKNLFNKNSVKTTRYINPNGAWEYNWRTNDFIQTTIDNPKSNYAISFKSKVGSPCVRVAFFNENKFLSRILYYDTNSIINVPSGCTKIIIHSDCNEKVNAELESTYTYFVDLQIEEGSTATEYEEYIEPKVYMLNENNEYVEVV